MYDLQQELATENLLQSRKNIGRIMAKCWKNYGKTLAELWQNVSRIMAKIHIASYTSALGITNCQRAVLRCSCAIIGVVLNHEAIYIKHVAKAQQKRSKLLSLSTLIWVADMVVAHSTDDVFQRH